MRRESKERVLGPYREGRWWRIYVYGPGGECARRRFASERQARDAAEKVRSAQQAGKALTVGDAIDGYEKYLTNEKGNKAGSVYQQTYRLGQFFPERELLLRRVTPELCAARYQALVADERELAADTHRNILAAAKAMLVWAVGKGYLPTNPAAAVNGQGRRQHGKAQLRIDEARRWVKVALEQAERGEAGAVAALCTLLLNLRASEIVERTVRDLDDAGALLWVPSSKTAAGRRTLEVPDLLRPYLLELARGKKPEALLFGKHWRDWVRKWVVRICVQAKVPEVTAHGMRGLHASLAMATGATGHAVALAMGHTSEAVTRQSYATQEAQEQGRQHQVLKVIQGGKR